MFVPQLASCLDPVARSDAYKHLPVAQVLSLGPVTALTLRLSRKNCQWVQSRDQTAS